MAAIEQRFREMIREEIRSALAVEQKPEPLLLDLTEAGELLSVPASWIAAAARRGEIPVVRLGHHVRFRKSDLDQFIEQQRHEQCTALELPKMRRQNGETKDTQRPARRLRC